jgi:hypothetical protein
MKTLGEPVVVGDMRVSTGDILYADRDGVCRVPVEIAEDVLVACQEIRQVMGQGGAIYRARPKISSPRIAVNRKTLYRKLQKYPFITAD